MLNLGSVKPRTMAETVSNAIKKILCKVLKSSLETQILSKRKISYLNNDKVVVVSIVVHLAVHNYIGWAQLVFEYCLVKIHKTKNFFSPPRNVFSLQKCHWQNTCIRSSVIFKVWSSACVKSVCLIIICFLIK